MPREIRPKAKWMPRGDYNPPLCAGACRGRPSSRRKHKRPCSSANGSNARCSPATFKWHVAKFSEDDRRRILGYHGKRRSYDMKLLQRNRTTDKGHTFRLEEDGTHTPWFTRPAIVSGTGSPSARWPGKFPPPKRILTTPQRSAPHMRMPWSPTSSHTPRSSGAISDRAQVSCGTKSLAWLINSKGRKSS